MGVGIKGPKTGYKGRYRNMADKKKESKSKKGLKEEMVDVEFRTKGPSKAKETKKHPFMDPDFKGVKVIKSKFAQGKETLEPQFTSYIQPAAKVVFQISYVEDGDTCRVNAKGTKYDVNVDSTNVPPSEAFVLDLIRGYLNTRPQ